MYRICNVWQEAIADMCISASDMLDLYMPAAVLVQGGHLALIWLVGAQLPDCVSCSHHHLPGEGFFTILSCMHMHTSLLADNTNICCTQQLTGCMQCSQHRYDRQVVKAQPGANLGSQGARSWGFRSYKALITTRHSPKVV